MPRKTSTGGFGEKGSELLVESTARRPTEEHEYARVYRQKATHSINSRNLRAMKVLFDQSKTNASNPNKTTRLAARMMASVFVIIWM